MNYWLTDEGLKPILLTERELFDHLFTGATGDYPADAFIFFKDIIAHQYTVFHYCDDKNRKRISPSELPKEYGLFAVAAVEFEDPSYTLDMVADNKAFLVTHLMWREGHFTLMLALFNKGVYDALIRKQTIDEFLADNNGV